MSSPRNVKVEIMTKRRVSCFRLLPGNTDKKTCFMFSPFDFSPERQKHETCLFVVISTFDLQGEDTKYTRRNNDILTGEGMKISLLKISCQRVEIFCVIALYCRVFALKREGRSNDKKT